LIIAHVIGGEDLERDWQFDTSLVFPLDVGSPFNAPLFVHFVSVWFVSPLFIYPASSRISKRFLLGPSLYLYQVFEREEIVIKCICESIDCVSLFFDRDSVWLLFS